MTQRFGGKTSGSLQYELADYCHIYQCNQCLMKQTCTQDVVHWQRQFVGEICQLLFVKQAFFFLQQFAMNVISRSVCIAGIREQT